MKFEHSKRAAEERDRLKSVLPGYLPSGWTKLTRAPVHLPNGDVVASYAGFGLRVSVTLKSAAASITFTRVDEEMPTPTDIEKIRALFSRQPNVKNLCFIYSRPINGFQQVLLL